MNFGHFPKLRFISIFWFGHSEFKLSKRQTAVFCSQLRSLLSSGLPLLAALEIIKDLPQNKKYAAKFGTLIENINNGQALSESAGEFLPAMATGSLSAAERAGNLEESLGRLADYFNGKAELDEKLISALIYPIFVAVLSLISVLVLIIFVIPGLKGLFSDFGGSLPPLTGFILSLSEIFSQDWPVGVVLIGAGLLLLCHFREKCPEKLEARILNLPFIGKLYRQELVIQGFGTLGSLLKGGAPIVEALSVTTNSTKSLIFKAIIASSKKGIENGGRLSAAFEAAMFFPADAIQMLKIGESSGQLDQMLISVADFQARERDLLLKRVTALIEPALTLTVGLVVGVVVLAMFLPLVNMISSLQ